MMTASRFSAIAGLLCAMLLGPVAARGDGFLTARPGYVFEFPRDHGSHPDFRTEWWYFTGHLTTRSGRRAGFEVTFFRVGISRAPAGSLWDLRDLSLAHFAITDVTGRKFRYYERVNRSTPFLAGSQVGGLLVFNEGWSVTSRGDELRIRASGGKDAVDLRLRSRKAPVIHGENGVSLKSSSGDASHYYSLTRLEAHGTMVVDGRREECSGTVWMDHEFGSSALSSDHAGWDWFSIQFDNDTELMLYLMRRKDGSRDTISSGSFVSADGQVIRVRSRQFDVRPRGRWRSRTSGAVYPMGWSIEIPDLQLSVTLSPLLEEQELVTSASTRVTYWEGAVAVSGSFGGTPVKGGGYVEMTGYTPK